MLSARPKYSQSVNPTTPIALSSVNQTLSSANKTETSNANLCDLRQTPFSRQQRKPCQQQDQAPMGAQSAGGARGGGPSGGRAMTAFPPLTITGRCINSGCFSSSATTASAET